MNRHTHSLLAIQFLVFPNLRVYMVVNDLVFVDVLFITDAI